VDREAVVQAISAESDRLLAAMLALTEADFDRPTRCAPWSVRDLLGHLLVACRRVGPMLQGPSPAEAVVAALAYFRDDELGGGHDPERIEAAEREAAAFSTGRELASAVAAAGLEMVSLARREPHGRLVRTPWDHDMSLTEYLKTRVFELAVHGLDLAVAVGRDPWLTEEAASVTESMLAEGMNVAECRAGWDRLTFIQKATGRTHPTDAEAARCPPGLLLWSLPAAD